MRLKAEIEAKETNREAFSKAYDKLRAENSRLKAENERLKEVIDDQNELCWNCNKSVKEFAEKLQKELPCRDYTFSGNTYSMVLTSSVKYYIDKLLKEYGE